MGAKYSSEGIRRVIELYKKGLGNRLISRETGINRDSVKWWIKQFRERGDSFLDKHCPPEGYGYALKEALVRNVLENGLSLRQVATAYGLSRGLASKWVKCVKLGGYESLMGRHKKIDVASLPEVERLRIELERAKTEIALLKKVKALMEERGPKLKEQGQKPSNH
jgi:transposase